MKKYIGYIHPGRDQFVAINIPCEIAFDFKPFSMQEVLIACSDTDDSRGFCNPSLSFLGKYSFVVKEKGAAGKVSLNFSINDVGLLEIQGGYADNSKFSGRYRQFSEMKDGKD